MQNKKSKICRVCLGDVKRATSLSESLMNEPIFRLINCIANVNISADDGLPSNICPQCVVELEAAVSFKQKCENNNIILRTASKRHLLEDYLTDKTKLEDVKHETEYAIVKLEEHSDNRALASSYSPRDSPDASHTDQVDYYTEPLDILKKDPNISGSVRAEIDKSDDEDKPLTSLRNESPNSKAIDLHLQCDDCKEYFRTKCKLRVHWKRVHLKEKLVCPTCLRRYNCYKSYNHHKSKPPAACKQASKFRIEYLGKKRMFHCKQCDYKSRAVRHMVIHDVTHTGARPYTCDLCGKTHTQLSTLLRHKESAHKLYKNIITCQYCGKLVKGSEAIYRHLKSHTDQSVQCLICGKTLKNKETLKDHMLRHRGIKSFQCEFCSKLFTTVSQCSQHKTIYHLNKRRIYDCESCPYKTHRKALLKKHQSKHVGSNVCCLKCGIFLDSEHKLKLHELRHINRPHACNICEKTFNRKDNLMCHYKKVHKTPDIKDETEQEKLSKKVKQKKTQEAVAACLRNP